MMNNAIVLFTTSCYYIGMDNILVICAWCKVVIKEGVKNQQGFVSHGICLSCKNELEQENMTMDKRYRRLNKETKQESVLAGFIVLFLLLAVFSMALAKKCHAYSETVTIKGNQVAVTGHLTTEERQDRDIEYANRMEKGRIIASGEVNRKQEIDVQAKKAEVLGRLKQLSAPSIFVSQSNVNNTEVRTENNG